MSSPDVIHDDVLGQVRVGGDDVRAGLRVLGREICLSADREDDDTDEALARARSVAGRLEQLAVSAMTYAAEELVGLANEWLDGEAPFEVADLRRRIRPSTLDIAGDGELTWYFDDGDVFGGHSILVRMSADGACVDVDIAG